jgi:hypothetical protein
VAEWGGGDKTEVEVGMTLATGVPTLEAVDAVGGGGTSGVGVTTGDITAVVRLNGLTGTGDGGTTPTKGDGDSDGVIEGYIALICGCGIGFKRGVDGVGVGADGNRGTGTEG